MRSTFTFNGHRCDEFGIYISKKPNINRSQRKFKSASVAGRNGNIYQMQDAWDEVIVSYDIFAGGYNDGDAPRDFTSIMEWLNSADDYAVLCDSFDTQHYRMAVFVDATNIEQKWYSTGKATIKFRCKPQNYLVGSVVAVEDGDTIKNSTNHIALPLINLTGQGTNSALDLTSKSMITGSTTVVSSQLSSLITQAGNGYCYWVKKYLPTYNHTISFVGSGTGGSATITNSTGTIVLTPSSNDWLVGIVTEVLPDTDYTLSFNSTSAGKAIIWFAKSGGYNDITGCIEMDEYEASYAWKFHTPAECGYILIGFGKNTNNASATASSIMLNTGHEAKTFNAYNPSTESFTINDTVLQFDANGFDSAEIDCERENFLIDGVEQNNICSVLDSNGNLSVDYLQLVKGDNVIAISSGIDAAVMDMRLWEL